MDLNAVGLYIVGLEVDDGELKSADTLLISVTKDPGVYGQPVAWWGFEELSGNQVFDRAGEIKDPLYGYSESHPGVLGNALWSSEYDTYIRREADQGPGISPAAFTLEAWIAPRVYPWNWAPLIMQKDESAGFFFGIDAYSRLGFWICTEKGWEKCTSRSPFRGEEIRSDFDFSALDWSDPDPVIPLLEWSHVVGTFSNDEGLKIYLNGELVGSLDLQEEMIPSGAGDNIGGETEARAPSNSNRVTPPAQYSFYGLLDEIKIYNTCLSGQEVKKAFNHAT